MLEGTVIKDGKEYLYSQIESSLTGCSSHLSSFALRENSGGCTEYYSWKKPIPYHEALTRHVARATRTGAGLRGLWGELAEIVWNDYHKDLPPRSVALLVGGAVRAVFWSDQGSVVVGEGGYQVPEFMIDPQLTAGTTKLVTQGVFVTNRACRQEILPLSKLRPLTLEANYDATYFSGQQEQFKKIVFSLGDYAECAAMRRTRDGRYFWNPEYHSGFALPWWEVWRLSGYRVPHAKVLLTAACRRFFSPTRTDPDIDLCVIGGNFGTSTGGESCRVVAYLQKLAVDSGTVMSSVFHKRGNYYTAVCPIVYRSELHDNAFVGAAFINKQQMEWRWKDESV